MSYIHKLKFCRLSYRIWLETGCLSICPPWATIHLYPTGTSCHTLFPGSPQQSCKTSLLYSPAIFLILVAGMNFKNRNPSTLMTAESFRTASLYTEHKTVVNKASRWSCWCSLTSCPNQSPIMLVLFFLLQPHKSS